LDLLLAAVFLLGVQVGRGVKTDRSLDATTADALATATPPQTASTPSQPVASSGPPAAEPPAPAQEPEDELSYAKRLQGDSAPAEKLKAAAPAAAAKPVQTKVVPPATTLGATPAPVSSPSTASASAPKGGSWVVQLVALKDRGDAVAMVTRLSAKGYPAFVLDPASGATAIYRVQVGGYPDRDHADQAARRIEREEKIQGYVRSR